MSAPKTKSADSPGRLSCMYRLSDDSRCQIPGPVGSFFCSRHLLEFFRAKPHDLLRTAAEALADCTSFTETGLPRIICKDFTRWGHLCNAAWGLESHGYRHMEELYPLLASMLLSIDRFRRPLADFAPPKWKSLEILVSRLYLQELAPILNAPNDKSTLVGAQVRWNFRKRGIKTKRLRQIDVAIWTRTGSLTSFYVVECKDSRITLGTVEEFKAKLEDLELGAKGIMFSSVGYDDGAKAAGTAHNIELFIVDELSGTKTVTRNAERFVPQVIKTTLAPSNPKGQIILKSPIRFIRLGSGLEIQPKTLFDRALEYGDVVMEKPHLATKLPVPNSIATLFDGTKLDIANVYVDLKMVMQKEDISVELPIHPIAFETRETSSDSRRSVKSDDLPLLAQSPVELGKYYVNPMSQRYFCKKVDGDLATMFLLDDPQYGKKLAVEFVADLKEPLHLYLLTDSATVRELELAMKRLPSSRVGRHK